MPRLSGLAGPFACLLAAPLFAAGTLPAQTVTRRDTTITRGDTAIREVIIRRAGPGDGAPSFAEPIVEVGPGRVEVIRTRAEPARSAVGLYLGQADADGLRVERVAADGPAARAGIAAGDRLIAVAGTSLRVDRADVGDPLLAAVPARRLERAVGRLAPGSEVELRVTRDGRERAVRVRTVAPAAMTAMADGNVEVREFRVAPDGWATGPSDTAYRRRVERYRGDMDPAAMARVRVTADSALARMRLRADSARARAAARPVLGLTLDGAGSARDTLGIFVGAVARGGPAERAGVVEGDRIAQLNAVDLRVPRDERGDAQAAGARRARFTRELERLKPGDRVTLRVWGDGRWRDVTATVGRAGDVYPQEAAMRFGVGGPEGAFTWPTPMPALAPMPPMAPMRMLRGMAAPRRPMPPVAPRAARRLVRI